jgi:hypothetical protein
LFQIALKIEVSSDSWLRPKFFAAIIQYGTRHAIDRMLSLLRTLLAHQSYGIIANLFAQCKKVGSLLVHSVHIIIHHRISTFLHDKLLHSSRHVRITMSG